jgi:tetratricopeptide (TPR) repeat protein
MRSVVGLLVVVTAVLPAGRALSADPNQRAEARKHYAEGVKHYDLAEYEEALREFKEAYRAADDPAFLFNTAQCYRKLGDVQEAITFYRNYLRKAPASPNRAEVERRIAELEREQASRPAPLAAASAGTQSPPVATAALLPARPEAEAGGPSALLVAPETSPPPETTRPFYRRGWFWVAVGVVAAGAVAAAIVLRPGAQPDFCSDCAVTTGIRQPQ